VSPIVNLFEIVKFLDTSFVVKRSTLFVCSLLSVTPLRFLVPSVALLRSGENNEIAPELM